MLLGDDVVDLKGIERMLLWQMAVFASRVRALPYELPNRGIHGLLGGPEYDACFEFHHFHEPAGSPVLL